MNLYLLTWKETNADGGLVDGRVDLPVAEDIALLFAASLMGDPRFSEVVLLRHENTITDLSEGAKGKLPSTKN